ncbi:MAG: class I SAM-dependent methyltransferase [Hyphomonadaceae bacterium]|jgi:SAM-dependent methyltransferase|nr:class I SAM-dependent methyltransferase [Hyphomonadaceae bacterium]
MRSAIPQRATWAVDALAVATTDLILEIGCGRGLAISLVATRLRTGQVTGLDRSHIAIAAAQRANAAHTRSGRARLLHAALADAPLDGPFDKIFAINVNVFWLQPAPALAAVRRVLAPRGRLHLFYEPPSPAQIEQLAARCTGFLQAAGFRIVDEQRADLGAARGLHIAATPSGRKLGSPPSRA